MHKRCTNKREETKSVVGKGIVSYGIEGKEKERVSSPFLRGEESSYNSLSRLFREAERFQRLVKIYMRVFVNISIRRYY